MARSFRSAGKALQQKALCGFDACDGPRKGGRVKRYLLSMIYSCIFMNSECTVSWKQLSQPVHRRNGTKFSSCWQGPPIKSAVWLGLTSIGVGVHSKAVGGEAALPPRKDLCQMLKFRAFAASVPLCSQRVGAGTTLATTGRSWRQRDTDITYSGN
jgi:hypothetical protein